MSALAVQEGFYTETIGEKAISAKEFAALIGVSPAYISKIKKQGKLPLSVFDGKKIFPEKAKAAMEASKDIARSKEFATIEGARQQDLPKNREYTRQHKLPTMVSFNEARTRKELAIAELKELEIEEKEGRLVELGRVEKQAFELARKVRDKIMAVPDRISANLAAMEDEFVVRQTLIDELTQALKELS